MRPCTVDIVTGVRLMIGFAETSRAVMADDDSREPSPLSIGCVISADKQRISFLQQAEHFVMPILRVTPVFVQSLSL